MALLRKMTYSEMVAYIEDNKILCKKLYISNDLTAREVAKTLQIDYNSNFAKALLVVLGQKGMGLGGARQGSGQKKKKK